MRASSGREDRLGRKDFLLGPPPAAVAKEGIQFYPALHHPAFFVAASLANIRYSLLLGAVLCAIRPFIFLVDGRTALISMCSSTLLNLVVLTILALRWARWTSE